MFEICIALEKDFPIQKKIWKTCFGDTDDYIEFFFRQKAPFCKPIIMKYEGNIVGSMYLMPVSAYEHGEIKKGFYAYAIGILPEYRGKGIYAEADRLITQYIKNNNMFCILSPANNKLCEYYKSFGFCENAFVCEKTLYHTNSCPKYRTTTLEKENFEIMRNVCFENAVFWDKASLDYVLRENIFCGGYNLHFEEEDTFALIRQTDDKIKVIESNITEEQRQAVTDYLCAEYNADSVTWILPYEAGGQNRLCGMTKNLGKDDYYLNLILD